TKALHTKDHLSNGFVQLRIDCDVGTVQRRTAMRCVLLRVNDHIRRASVLSFALVSMAAAASAGPITFTLTTTGTGTIGNSNFTDAPITIVGFGDTSTVEQSPLDTFTFELFPVQTTVGISGIGTGVLTDPGYIFDVQNVPGAGFGTTTSHAGCQAPPGCDL